MDLPIDKKEFDKRINSLKLQSNNKYKGVVKNISIQFHQLQEVVSQIKL